MVIDVESAIRLQRELQNKIIHTGDLSSADLIAGADTSSDSPFLPRLRREAVNRCQSSAVDSGSFNSSISLAHRGLTAVRMPDLIHAAVVVWSRSQQKVIAQASASFPAAFPYIPGLLAFRELPALLEAFANLTVKPEAVIVDGQGIAHPRRCGIACHLGLELSLPAVGCAKSRLCGYYEEPANQKGAQSLLMQSADCRMQNAECRMQNEKPKAQSLKPKAEEIGCVVRTRSGVKPVFISPGHLCDAENAVKLVLACCTKYRLPEPVRAAHKLAGEVMRQSK
ncbi:MAG: endonuclease V [Calditrichaeota bacterium]|nr:endonuclease V [Calditrichota bacterium]